jgi:hypothetical protein
MSEMTTERRAPLPTGFVDLEMFVPKWALARESDRIKERWSSSIEDIRHFYDAMVLRLDAIIDYLNKFALDDLPEPDRQLFYLTLSLAEVADAIEAFGTPEVPYSLDPSRYIPTESDET